MSVGAQIDLAIQGRTALSHFVHTSRAVPEAVALRWRASTGEQHLTWAEYADRAGRLAAALRELGVRPGDRVVLMMTNRPEFYVADVAVLLAGATPVSIYNSSSPEQIAYIVDHCEAAMAIVGDPGQYERVRAAGVRTVLTFDNVHDLPGTNAVELDDAAAAVRPADLLTLIYTSGTTGPPKAVALSHANICWLMESWARAMGTARGSGSMTGWRMVSYLPMAHIAERLFSYYLHMAHGTEVTTCPDPTLVNDYLLAVQPHCFFGPPRAWEKFHATIRVTDPERADRVEKLDEDDKRALRTLIGLPDCRMALTGAAPMQPDVHRFILDIGIPLSEIYGLSECTGPMTWSPHDVRPGTVGPPIPGEEVRLADDGEVLARGGNVFNGYLKDPERTAEVLDAEGWLHTGDIGEFTADGYLRIVDRKKELIITAGGKNISPANLEAALKSYPLIGQACAVGDSRPYVTALIVPDPEVTGQWARDRGLTDLTLDQLAALPELHEAIAGYVAEANRRFSRVEQIKEFAVLGAEWLPDSDELTPTMKLKRRVIHEKYAAHIEALYPAS